MQFRNFTWPNEPSSLRVTSGTAARTVTGEGVFFGETAYESLRTLEALLAQGGAGALTLPHVGTLQAVLTELEGGQEPRENFVRYRFTFVEAA